MRSHISTLLPRMIQAGLKIDQCRYRVIAAGIDNRSRIISIATNRPRLKTRGLHAEERLIYCSPKSLSRILIIRINRRGDLLPIHACRLCQKLADRRGIQIESMREI